MRLARLHTASVSTLWALLGACLLLRLAYTIAKGNPPDLPTYFHLHFALGPRLLEIYAGALAALLLGRFQAPVLKRDSYFLGSLLLSIVLLVAFTRLGGETGKFYYTHGIFVPFGLLLLAAAFCNEGLVSRFAGNRVVAYVASASILIWLFHIPIDTYWKRGWIVMGVSLEWVQSFPSALLSLLATLVFACLFRPLLMYRPFRRS